MISWNFIQNERNKLPRHFFKLIKCQTKIFAFLKLISGIFLSASGPYDNSKSAMPRLAEEEEQMLGGPGHAPPTRRQLPPALPPMPSGLSPEQLKRRHIVASLVHSENNYVASLQRLVNVSVARRQITSRLHLIPHVLCHVPSVASDCDIQCILHNCDLNYQI